ncbi:hypothetical protein JST97_30080 [bacterium]|nr:hypothetical protein [bacterium]
MIHTQNGNVYAPHLEARRERQHDRIKDGIQDGSLSSEELAKLNAMRKDARQDLAEAKGDNGWVGPAERREINRDMNQISRAIYAFKHN